MSRFSFVFGTLIVQPLCALGGGEFAMFNVAILVVLLFVPCRDRQFGNRGTHFWVRQTILVVAALLTATLAVRRKL